MLLRMHGGVAGCVHAVVLRVALLCQLASFKFCLVHDRDKCLLFLDQLHLCLRYVLLLLLQLLLV